MKSELLRELIDAAELDHPRAIQLLCDHPEARNERTGLGETALHFLAVEGFAKGVRFLCEQDFDPSATNEFGNSVLTEVSLLGNIEMATILLDKGADPNAISETWVSALHVAVSKGNKALVQLLLKHGADPNVQNAVESCPLHKAAEKGDLEIFEMLLDAGASVDYVTPFGESLRGLGELHAERFALFQTALRKRGMDLQAQYAYNAYMKRNATKQFTVRSVPLEVERALRRQARIQHKSLNAVLLDAICRAAGNSVPPRRYHDLEKYIGTMQPDPELDRALEDQRRIDPEMWQ